MRSCLHRIDAAGYITGRNIMERPHCRRNAQVKHIQLQDPYSKQATTAPRVHALWYEPHAHNKTKAKHSCSWMQCEMLNALPTQRNKARRKTKMVLKASMRYHQTYARPYSSHPLNVAGRSCMQLLHCNTKRHYCALLQHLKCLTSRCHDSSY